MREQLEQILEAPQFSQAARLRKFLTYVVEETLEGRKAHLNQYALAMDVFERDETFDPSIDAIVRVEAARLRSKLREFYYETGEDAPVVIELAKGGYAAAFHLHNTTENNKEAGKELPASPVISAGAKQTATVENPPAEPTIAVLPFVDMSPFPDQDYLADGLCEDLMTDLSKVSGLSVIARQSTFAYKGKPTTVKQICAELGADYAIEGSVRKAGDKLRINAQLIEGLSEKHLWADRYDCDYTDIFTVQDQVNRDIINALSFHFTPSRTARAPTSDILGYDYLLLGVKEARSFTKEGSANARYCYERAIELDPNYADAHARLSINRVFQWIACWDNSHQSSVGLGLELARRAVVLDEASSFTHAALCWALMWNGEHDRAIEIGRKACALNPNDVDALERLSMTLGWAGEPEAAFDTLVQAQRLNPLEPYNGPKGMLKYMQHDYSQAIDLFEHSIALHASFIPAYLYLASIYGAMGKKDKAAQMIRKITETNPNYIFTRSRYAQLKHEDDRDRFAAGLHAAGVKEFIGEA